MREDELKMTNDQIPMTNWEACYIGHWCLDIGHSVGKVLT
jgi:hypothetical protein